jgi:hypothetical protein
VQAVFIIAYYGLPAEFTGIFTSEPERVVRNWHLFICVAVGLWGGLVIGLVTEYFTSNRYKPVQVLSFLSSTDTLLPQGISLITWGHHAEPPSSISSKWAAYCNAYILFAGQRAFEFFIEENCIVSRMPKSNTACPAGLLAALC